MDIDGQGEGWTKCSGWPHRTDRRLTGVLDNLGRIKKPDWERACRRCPGWDVTGTNMLADQAARGSDERLWWYLPVPEAQD